MDDTTPEFKREGEDDQDLLTYGEVGIRVEEEITAVRLEIEVLQGVEGSDEKIGRLEARIDGLRDAGVRNSRHRINDQNFEKFFGYVGTPRYR
jgi:hypothetical protein